MLPRSYNSGFSNDIRGLKKRSKPFKIYQQIAPYAVVVLFILLLVVVLTLTANIRHEKTKIARLEGLHRSKEAEIRNLANSLEQERKSRVSAENGLREVNLQLSGTKRELQELQNNKGVTDQHAKSLEESFERTRVALEKERDTARRELEDARKRMLSMESELGAKDSTIDAHKLVAVRKDELHANKEKQWEALHAQLEEQLRKQGGYLPQRSAPSQSANEVHPDYAAQEGSGIFHFTSDGHRERFIDTAKDLATIGVMDPDGTEHLASVMGHLLEIKQAEYEAIAAAYPAASPPPKPPIGHWMALNLERMGIKIPHGVMHLSFFLDAHFALDNNPELIGRGTDVHTGPAKVSGNTDTGESADTVADPIKIVNVAQQSDSETAAKRGSSAPSPPGAQPQHTGGLDSITKLGRGRKSHKVDAAGFI